MDSGGRPPIWTDPQAFAESVEKYFMDEKTPTWTGLALHLGFCSRDSLNDYKKKEGFSDPIKKALLRIEQKYEKGLSERNPAGSIFALKNFGWKDKHDITNETIIRHLTVSDDEPAYPLPLNEDESGQGIPESVQ